MIGEARQGDLLCKKFLSEVKEKVNGFDTSGIDNRVSLTLCSCPITFSVPLLLWHWLSNLTMALNPFEASLKHRLLELP